MKINFFSHIENTKKVYLWLWAVLISVLLTEILVSVMNLLLKGKIDVDYLMTGFIASLFVATLMVSVVNHFVTHIGYLQQDNAYLHATAAELKQSELKLERNNKQLNALIEAIPDAIFLKDGDGRWLITNELAKQLFVLHDIPWQGKTEMELADLHPEFRAAHEACVIDDEFAWISGCLSLFSETVVSETGQESHFEVRKVPVFNEQGERQALVIIGRDVTEHKKSEMALIEARELAEKANRAKSEFLSSMSHELRTPMNAVLGFSQLLEFENLTEDQHDSVKEILTAGHHLMDLINQVLDLSKIEAEQLEMHTEEIDLNTLMQNCVDLVQPLTHKNDIRIIDNILTSSCMTVIADSLQLKQVLLNLLSNAIKYNRVGGTITLSCVNTHPQRVRINVADTGKGLSSVEITKLFQAFERLSAKNTSIEGTGIGLCISKKLIEGMNGRIGVESVVGEGSCFWIEIPLAL